MAESDGKLEPKAFEGQNMGDLRARLSSELDISPVDPRMPGISELIRSHLAFANQTTPKEHVHALDLEGLVVSSLTFYGGWFGGEFIAMGAVNELSSRSGEMKSMHTRALYRGLGVGRRMLNHLIAESRSRHYDTLLLETGTMVEFQPARKMYQSAGFVPCEPFGSYTTNPFSVCMCLDLRG